MPAGNMIYLSAHCSGGYVDCYPGRGNGEVAEWSIAAVLKTVDPQGSGGSNPSLSANGV